MPTKEELNSELAALQKEYDKVIIENEYLKTLAKEKAAPGEKEVEATDPEQAAADMAELVQWLERFRLAKRDRLKLLALANLPELTAVIMKHQPVEEVPEPEPEPEPEA